MITEVIREKKVFSTDPIIVKSNARNDKVPSVFDNDITDTICLSILEQETNINSIIQIVGNPERASAKPDPSKSANQISITTDTHGDFISLLGSLYDSGVIEFDDPTEFMYYNIEENDGGGGVFRNIANR